MTYVLQLQQCSNVSLSYCFFFQLLISRLTNSRVILHAEIE